ncbi:hypothetical protein P8891_06270 [Bacillus atrophaeus]|uniref:hypothetical protein n=1 Tax=Bacillus atrophaeus TaxID=1452 RepID=UPI002280B68D|nr:hypothetical protein [Bacillus atrophaeus]MCY7948015.1 hypothetical protein [Bacillus atrophaeus]MCY8098040.1 hypothetical protein [Bacillus atrophaeus]MCY9169964.1 hypothetical protein [Bacillus atrophaeus]MEC0740689.1 hypothetical protein [Bacillus atrophaeus]MEC0747047.1 hypothetical protein [Bacillus atrophaeus]
MQGFDTGYKDILEKPFLVGSEVSWIDSEGYPCESKIVVKNGCKIGIDSWEGFKFVCDFDSRFKVIDEDSK